MREIITFDDIQSILQELSDKDDSVIDKFGANDSEAKNICRSAHDMDSKIGGIEQDKVVDEVSITTSESKDKINKKIPEM